jgi:hypothetical protein
MLVTRGDDWLTSGENSWLRCTNEIIAECYKTSLNSTEQSSRSKQFRNYRGLIRIARCGFLWEKTTKRSIASLYTNCETALVAQAFGEGRLGVCCGEALLHEQRTGSLRGQWPGKEEALHQLAPYLG